MGQKKKLRDLVGVLKDKASFSKAALLYKPNTSSLQLAVLRATTHEPSNPPHEKHVSALLSFGHSSRITASFCIEILMDRLHNTQNSSVALKCLITVHNVIKRGSFILQDQISVYPSTGGRNYLNLSNFRDDCDPKTWELSSWVRWYAKFLERLLLTFRVLGFFLSSSSSSSFLIDKDSEEEKVSGLLNWDLVKEINELVGIIEEIWGAPELLYVGRNNLVFEVMRLVGEDYQIAQNEIFLRVNELKQRLSCLSFGESVELVYVLKKLGNFKERLMLMFPNRKTEMEDLFWDSITEMIERLGSMKENEKGGRLVITGRRERRASESDRFGDRVVKSIDSVLFSSRRLDSCRSFPIIESVDSVS